MDRQDSALLAELERAAVRAWQAPFFRKKLQAAGFAPGTWLDWNRWRAIPPTTKDELRAMPSFSDEVLVAPRDEIAEYWRSGGVTGRPLFYPRTHADIEASLEGFANALRLCGVGGSDVFLCSLPIGIHPAGQQTARAAELLGAAAIWAGAGNQTPSAAQIELVHELRATVWCGMASFGLHLGHLAEAAGKSLADSAVHTVITTAEVLSPKKRELLERLWGARVLDMFGMSEVTLMGAECGRRPGLHVWRTHSFCEVLDEGTLEPVKPGEVGVLCVTPLRTGNAVPFLRWLSGDVVRIEEGCDCAHRDDPRLIHAGRTLAFFKV
ncbi:MAG: phenylacetate--CoA ligase family protein, partial [Candidatus Binatia bacterium]